jgi:hypothetical protein
MISQALVKSMCFLIEGRNTKKNVLRVVPEMIFCKGNHAFANTPAAVCLGYNDRLYIRRAGEAAWVENNRAAWLATNVSDIDHVPGIRTDRKALLKGSLERDPWLRCGDQMGSPIAFIDGCVLDIQWFDASHMVLLQADQIHRTSLHTKREEYRQSLETNGRMAFKKSY